MGPCLTLSVPWILVGTVKMLALATQILASLFLSCGIRQQKVQGVFE